MGAVPPNESKEAKMPSDVSSSAAAALASANGGTAQPQLDAELETLIAGAIRERAARLLELEEEMAVLKPELRRYERIHRELRGEAKPPGKPRGRSKRHPRSSTGIGVSDERLGEIKDAILKVAQRQDEFRQVDV